MSTNKLSNPRRTLDYRKGRNTITMVINTITMVIKVIVQLIHPPAFASWLLADRQIGRRIASFVVICMASVIVHPFVCHLFDNRFDIERIASLFGSLYISSGVCLSEICIEQVLPVIILVICISLFNPQRIRGSLPFASRFSCLS